MPTTLDYTYPSSASAPSAPSPAPGRDEETAPDDTLQRQKRDWDKSREGVMTLAVSRRLAGRITDDAFRLSVSNDAYLAVMAEIARQGWRIDETPGLCKRCGDAVEASNAAYEARRPGDEDRAAVENEKNKLHPLYIAAHTKDGE